MHNAIKVGAVAYDPKVVTIWEGIKDYFRDKCIKTDYILFSNHDTQGEMLLAGFIDIAWNTNLAYVKVFHFVGINAGPPTLSPDGRRLAFIASTPNRKNLLWVRPLDALLAQPLEGTEEASYPCWSPDGRFIGFFADGNLKKIEALGGPALTLCDVLEGRGGTWNQDGVIVFAPDTTGALYRVAAAGGSASAVTKVDQARQETRHRWPYFLPDGRHFLYVARGAAVRREGEAGGVYVASLERKETKLLLHALSNIAYAQKHLLFLRERTLMAQPFDPSGLQSLGEAFPIAEQIQYEASTNAAKMLSAPFSPPLLANRKEKVPMIDVNRLPIEGEGGLIDLLKTVTDPREPRGVRHPIVCIVAIATCACLSGTRSFEAIAQWAGELSKDALKRLGCKRKKPPSEKCFRLTLQRLDAVALDSGIGGWLARQNILTGKGIAVDGKTLRGAHDGDKKAPHLLSAVVHQQGIFIAQQPVDEKTNEIPCIKPLLDGLNIEGVVVTADSLHTQTETARYIVEDKKADYVFTVKDNQPTLKQDIQGLGLEAFPPSAH